MNFLFLLGAAVLEAGGDALVRRGREALGAGSRLSFFLAGALVLFAYGFFVNRPGLTFGRSLGVYVFLFFVVAQVLSWAVFHEPPGRGAYAGAIAFAIGAGLVYFVK